jgi:hypothetical protein
MPNGLPQRRLDEMFAAYAGKPSIQWVSTQCRVHRGG